MNEQGRLGFFGQLRAQHWATKFILVFVLTLICSPFIGGAMLIAYSMFGAGGAFLLSVAGVLFAGWFVFTTPEQPTPEDSAEPASQAVTPLPSSDGRLRNYCESCGRIFNRGLTHCPGCNAEWSRPVMSDPVAEIVRHLNLVTSDFEAGLIDRASYNRVRCARTTKPG
ncbi:MAG: hypothetical protein U0837_18095 [Dehalococcoidia bacterium]